LSAVIPQAEEAGRAEELGRASSQEAERAGAELLREDWADEALAAAEVLPVGGDCLLLSWLVRVGRGCSLARAAGRVKAIPPEAFVELHEP
jgi:hypothetical protein